MSLAVDRLRSILLQALPLLALYALVRRGFFRAGYLPEDVYWGPSVAVGALSVPKFLIVVVAPIAFFLWRRQRLRWEDLQPLPQLRWFVAAVCAVIAYAYAAMDYNLYFDRGHLLDRILLITLALLVLWRPIFVWPFIGLAIAFINQLTHPLPGFSWLDKVIVVESTLLFCAMLAAQSVRRQDWILYPVLTAGLLASDYVIPAIAKLQIDWLEVNDLFDLTVSTHLNGWLAFVPRETFLQWVDWIHWMNWPLKIGTLVIEFGAIFVLARRRVFYVVAWLTVALHIGIFVTSGIFFWKWILLNLSLITLVWKSDRASIERMFGWRMVALTAIVVASSPWHVRPTWLAWYDTPLSEYFELEAVTEDGSVFPVRRDWMAPYDLIFSQNRFHHCVDEAFLSRTFSALGRGRERYDDLRSLRTAEDHRVLLERDGWRKYDAEQAAEFDRFLQLYFGSLNDGRRKHGLVPWIKAPYHIWNSTRGPRFDRQGRVDRIQVRLIRELYLEGNIVPIENRIVRTIEIPATRPKVTGPS